MKIPTSIFKEYDIRGKYPQEIDENTAYSLGLAFAKIMKAKKIVIGRDARSESEKVFWPLVKGLADGGLSVSDLGVCATPELFFANGIKKFPCGCMVTASHSPNGETGFKFCDGQGRVYGLKTGLQKLQKQAEKDWREYEADKNNDKNIKTDFISIAPDYKKFALSFIRSSQISGLKVVLDASGGAGAHLADVVFSALPVKTVYMNFRAGDQFPDHGLNPLLKENQASISEEIKNSSADLGVIFDGDADRAVFIDERGEFVEPYYINCLLAEIVLKLKKNITIAVDARLNLAISKVIKDNGGRALIHRSGYANFIQTLSAQKMHFGCENSGHFMLNFLFKKKVSYVYGDAIIPVFLIMKQLKKSGYTLSQLIKKFKDEYAISGELNFPNVNFLKLSSSLKKRFKNLKTSELDGLSIWGKKNDWFINLRPSHTESLVRLNIEARTTGDVEELKSIILAMMK